MLSYDTSDHLPCHVVIFSTSARSTMNESTKAPCIALMQRAVWVPQEQINCHSAPLGHSSVVQGPRKVACVFFDYTKAFDTVPHNSLLNKLHGLEIPNPLLMWIKNYLSGRLQGVVLNGQSSSWLPVSSGVPQGSILGLLLFLTYINDLADSTFSAGTQLLMFADDLYC